MTLRRKFKAWLPDIFPSENGIQNAPRKTGGFFNNAERSTVHNSTMTAVQGNQYNTVTYSEGNRHIMAQMMGLLSQHIIRDAAHDSSARQTSSELLWITGPAVVGKSAVVQTFAEYLVKSHFLVVYVFISRPNKRDNPHGVFITIAYQLATRIEAYRDYVVERLRLDPELLSGDLQAQFTTFIIEPFTVKKLGAGGKRWGILLDGLDELRGIDEQCEIIHLISSFAHEHPNAPLAWKIASRPESRISHTFEDKEVRHIYAEVAMQFIRDPHHTDPVARFEVLLSVINRSNTVPS
ncbi:hypothetical protein Agabi119p4_6129 [Agaricus bisporus var. burnettii]|uniref:Nephrocystin 3-like N-terminal domain-containing protein n=1 Tax=Agaricus bisporus var. burnettii TaxID=192524 RepID=A0A8H7F1D3_AGABI|nr:hypothetical protein Agabi119p4_6129 [Agaricus bisporus var. burnettii]